MGTHPNFDEHHDSVDPVAFWKDFGVSPPRDHDGGPEVDYDDLWAFYTQPEMDPTEQTRIASLITEYRNWRVAFQDVVAAESLRRRSHHEGP